ncbi:hypothetical protein NCY62_04380 [Acinetobacter pittii]|uniref:hypothetical protein n=1 Tax=Acinetobacter pittii TaxID=48296 RepID=UPI00202E2083|nr:hypothetical protein [Acinetobacter pittii]MCM1961041.1 hypothetical protein [Acinetobacter pittii]MCM1977691.1 hypothetical protein [Acinetobacter pittii]
MQQSLSNLEAIIAKFSFVTSTIENSNCLSCNQKIKARSRMELKKLFQNELSCQNCLSKDINNQAEVIIEKIESVIKDEYSFLFMKNSFNLTYLEKIYLYLIALKCQVNQYGKLDKEIWKDMFITERANQNFLIKSLYKKRVIFNSKKTDEIIGVFNDTNKFFYKNSHLIRAELASRYKKYKYIFFDGNTFLNLDLISGSFNQMLEELSIELDYYELDYLDVKEIREFIIEQKKIDAYELILNIQKYKPIPIEKSIELDHVIIELVEKYNLLVVNSMLSYHADKVASNLYSLEHGERKDRYYSVNKMFIARITSYLEHCKLNNKVPSHTRNIGFNWSYTCLEYFVCKSIINDGLSWTTFSGDELIHKWLNSGKVTIKPDF